MLASSVHRKRLETVTNPVALRLLSTKNFQFLGEIANPRPETGNIQKISGTALHTRNKAHYQDYGDHDKGLRVNLKKVTGQRRS